MSASNFLMEKLSKHALGIQSFSMPTTFEMALFLQGADSEQLKNNVTDHEVSDTGYARVDVSDKFLVESDGTITLDSTVTFPNMPAVTIQFLAVLNNDNIFFFARASAPIVIPDGQDFDVNPADFEVSGI